jgi:phosphohistidine phosphatase
MILYLIQHGEAESTAGSPERTLTEAGKAGITKTASFFKQQRPAPPEIWHSGKLRALQTAEILRGIACPNSELTVHQYLNPMDPVGDIAIELEALELHQLVIVGHLPHLGRLASYLLTGDRDSMPISFQNAGIVCLRGTHGRWETEWIVTPSILR